MAEQIQINTEDHNPTLEEQAAAQDAAATSQEGGEEKKILGKFDSYEDLEKSYAELEKKLGQLNQNNDAAQEAEAESEGTTEDGTEEQAREAVENAGLNFDALTASYAENGSLTDDDYASLEEAGIPRNVVDQFIAGQEAQIALMQNQVFSAVGGEARYDEMSAWAADNLSEGEIEIYNREVNSGDQARVMYAVKGLKAQFEASSGFEPQRQISGKGSAGDKSAYVSWAQVQADMSDPRYQADPAFRATVEAKLARSGSLK